MAKMKVEAVILAAGLSSRMGSFKPLLSLGSRTFIGHTINLFQTSGINEIVVVAGHRSEEVIPEVEHYNCRYVFNKNFNDGMFSSIQTGVQSLNPDCDAFFLLPVDIPLVRQQTIKKLILSMNKDSSSLVYYPRYRSKRGHPPLVNSRLIDPIIHYNGNGGMRSLLRRYEDQTTTVSVHDPYILMDANTMDEFIILADYH